MVKFLYPIFGLSIARTPSKEELLFARYKSRQFMNRALHQDSDEEFLNAVGEEYELIVEKAIDYLANRRCSEAFYTGLLDLKGDIDALAEIMEQRLESAPYNQDITAGLGFDVLFDDMSLANDNIIEFQDMPVDVASPPVMTTSDDSPPSITCRFGRDTIIK